VSDSDLVYLRAQNERLGAENAELRARLTELECGLPLSEVMQEGLLVVDVNGRIVGVNRRCCELLAHSEAELLGRFAAELIPSFDSNRRNWQSPDRPEGEARPYEATVLRPDGKSLCLRVALSPRVDAAGRDVGTLILLCDVTELSETRQLLRLESELNEKFISLNPHGISIYDREGRPVRANQAHLDLFRAPPPPTYSLLHDPLLHAAGYADKLAAMQNGQPVLLPEVWYNTHDIDPQYPDNPLCLEAMGFPILDDRGLVKNFVIMHRDITHQKRAEEAALRKQRLLGHLLNVYERDRQMVVFDIHDGLAQQIHSARLQLETYADLRTRATADAEPMLDSALALLSRASEEVRRLIVGLRPPVLEQQGVVAAISDLIWELAEQGGPAIEFRHGERFSRLAPPMESAIYRIVQEALTNIVRHSKSPRARIVLTERGRRLQIKIRDWGQGFDVSAMAHQRFGLRGIRERARLFHGKARIRSALGKGTLICVELPIVPLEPSDGVRS